MCTCDPCTCSDCKCGTARLGDLERRVMDVLWEEPGREMTGREVLDKLPGYAYTTVATVLDRLTHKGVASRDDTERAIRFRAIGSEAAHSAMLMRKALEAATDQDAALVTFARTVTAEEARILRHALEELEHESTSS